MLAVEQVFNECGYLLMAYPLVSRGGRIPGFRGSMSELPLKELL